MFATRYERWQITFVCDLPAWEGRGGEVVQELITRKRMRVSVSTYG